MEVEVEKLISGLYKRSINEKQFLKSYFNFKNVEQTNEYVLKLLKKGIDEKDSDTIQEVLVLLSLNAFPHSFYISELCELLQIPWHNGHEDIAMFLKRMADPSTVECLYKASELQFEYLNYDSTYQFARKCIKALSAIGNEDAIEKLKLLSVSKTEEIAEYAKKELRYKGLL